jgi:acetoin utilization protein AcuB
MLAEELIVDNIPPLQRTDSGETALRWMDEFKVLHLSVVDGSQFLGTISESDVLGMSDLGESIANYLEWLNPAFVSQNQHIFEVVKVVNDQKLSIIPVLDSQEHYVGSITIAQLMKIIADMPVANNPGAIIVMEINTHDYSLAMITRIIEENNTKILGTFVTSHPDSTKMELTIKVNRIDISSVIAALQRHGYHITFFDDEGSDQEDMRDRFDSFMNYLNI